MDLEKLKAKLITSPYEDLTDEEIETLLKNRLPVTPEETDNMAKLMAKHWLEDYGGPT